MTVLTRPALATAGASAGRACVRRAGEDLTAGVQTMPPFSACRIVLGTASSTSRATSVCASRSGPVRSAVNVSTGRGGGRGKGKEGEVRGLGDGGENPVLC